MPKNIKKISNEVKSFIKDEGYQKYLDNLRVNSVLKNQAIGPKGLFNVEDIENQIAKDTKIIVSAYKHALEATHNGNKINSFYLFGWSGQLSHAKRVEAAHELYEQIQKEISKIKHENIKIEICAHSHGGNVALNLETAEKALNQGLQIEKLFLFGTPIQDETKDFVYSDVFKKIYNFYSTGDVVQTLDVISTSAHKVHRKFNLPQLQYKIKEIEVRVDKKKPLHNEFWLSGNYTLYRKNFLLYPFPIVVFTPYMEKAIDDAYSSIENIQNFLLRIHKENVLLIFIAINKSRLFFRSKIISQLKIENIQYLKKLQKQFTDEPH